MSKGHSTIKHFSHNHALSEVNGVGTYTCNGCKLFGYGNTYRCNDCDYDLHEYCATCPPTLRNSWHSPDHELSLINGPTHMVERTCYVCRFYIQGMFYKCIHCSFESHPLCTHGPMHSSSPGATVTKQRSLHDHTGHPTSPHHYGQGNPYAHVGPYWPYPHGGGHHHQHQHQYQHPHPHPHAHPYTNTGSPETGPNPDSSKGKKKNSGISGAFKVIGGLTLAIGTNLVAATVTESVMNEE